MKMDSCMIPLIKCGQWPNLTRREICSVLLRCLTAGGFLYVTGQYIQGISASSLEVSFPERPRAGGVIFNHNVYLVGLDGDVKALSARCPHLGCRLVYHATDHRFRCPCHGSFFSLDGRRLGGPAEKDMSVLDFHTDDKCGTYKVILPLS
jgi:Rieske Fe-S protein